VSAILGLLRPTSIDEEAAGLQPSRRTVARDAFVSTCAVQALANIACDPGAGRRALLASNVVGDLRSSWFWLGPRLQCIAAARIAEPLTRHAVALNKLSADGVTHMFCDAIRLCYVALLDASGVSEMRPSGEQAKAEGENDGKGGDGDGEESYRSGDFEGEAKRESNQDAAGHHI